MDVHNVLGFCVCLQVSFHHNHLAGEVEKCLQPEGYLAKQTKFKIRYRKGRKHWVWYIISFWEERGNLEIKHVCPSYQILH